MVSPASPPPRRPGPAGQPRLVLPQRELQPDPRETARQVAAVARFLNQARLPDIQPLL